MAGDMQGEPIGPGTLIHMARELGWRPPERMTVSSEGSTELVEWELTAKGGIKPHSFPNAMLAVKKLGLLCRHDVFHDRKLVDGDLAENAGPELSDAIARAVREKIFATWDFDPGKDNVQEALERACERNRLDPVRDYVDSLVWDGVARLDTWLAVYLGAEDTPLNRAFGRKTLIAAVHRVREPGCKFDNMLVLEGAQGSGKSSAIRILAGGDDNFSDQSLDLRDKRDQQEAVSGVWFYEVAELEGVRKADIEATKAFLSRTRDKARPAYGRFRVDRPRRCIFMGTTNAGRHNGYLRDGSGNRRFWPVAAGKIDLDALDRDRDQILAEAAALEAKGESLTIDECLYGEAAKQQALREVGDPWEDELASLGGKAHNREDGMQEEHISSREILNMHLKIPTDRPTDGTLKRLSRVMKRLGWQGPKRMREGEQVFNGYFRVRQ